MVIDNKINNFEHLLYHLKDKSIMKKSDEEKALIYKDLLRKEYETKKAEEEKLNKEE